MPPCDAAGQEHGRRWGKIGCGAGAARGEMRAGGGSGPSRRIQQRRQDGNLRNIPFGALSCAGERAAVTRPPFHSARAGAMRYRRLTSTQYESPTSAFFMCTRTLVGFIL